MARTWEDVHRYVPVLVREDLRRESTARNRAFRGRSGRRRGVTPVLPRVGTAAWQTLISTQRAPQYRRSTLSTASRPGERARVLKQETTILSPDLQLVPNVVIKHSGWEVSGILREELGHALTTHARLSELPAKNSCRGSRLLALFRYARKQNTSVVRPLTCRSRPLSVYTHPGARRGGSRGRRRFSRRFSSRVFIALRWTTTTVLRGYSRCRR